MATKYFFNVSNHPSSNWSKEQLEAVNNAIIEDLSFPFIRANGTTNEIANQARCLVDAIISGGHEHDTDNIIAMVQGEMTFTYALVHEFQKRGVTCVAACSDRIVEEVVNPDGSTSKKSTFKFVQFREYPTF